MSGGQHRDDEEWAELVETERSRNRESHQPSSDAETHGCASEKQNLRRNVLDGAGFVRDVLDSYLGLAGCGCCLAIFRLHIIAAAYWNCW